MLGSENTAVAIAAKTPALQERKWVWKEQEPILKAPLATS